VRSRHRVEAALDHVIDGADPAGSLRDKLLFVGLAAGAWSLMVAAGYRLLT
jgi:hypothetical protein